MTRPQGRLVRAMRRGAPQRQAEALRHREMGVQADLVGSAVAGPTAVQLAIELAQSLDSGPRPRTPATSPGIEAGVPIT
jgi:hypothetical protein